MSDESVALSCHGCDCNEHKELCSAIVEAANAEPAVATGGLINRLKGLLSGFGSGVVLQEIEKLLASGMTELPQILAALQASGVLPAVLPAWVSMVISLLVTLLPKPTTT